MFNVNPASIPTIPTPLGVEVIASSVGEVNAKPNMNFALIKGFSRVGTAVSTSSDNTFYSYNLAQGFIGSPSRASFEESLSQHSTTTPTINLGSAVSLLQEQAQKFVTPTMGLVARFNKLSKAWDYGIGTSINSEHVTMGLSSIRTRGDRAVGVPETTTTTGNFGLKLSKLNIEYTLLYYRTTDVTVMTLPIFNDPVQIFTASYQWNSFIATGAYRAVTNIVGKRAYLWLVALQYQFNSHFALSYLSNYVPDTKSLGLQLFF